MNEERMVVQGGLSFSAWAKLVGTLVVLVVVGILLFCGRVVLQTIGPWFTGSLVVTLTIFVPVLAISGVYWIYSSAQNKKIQARLVRPNQNNAYAAMWVEDERRFVQPVNGLLPTVVPQTYSPQIHNHNDVNQLVKLLEMSKTTVDEVPLLEPQLPGRCDFMDVLDSGFVPSEHEIFLGYLPGGASILSRVEDLCHVANAGATGGGKSSNIRMVAGQLLHEDVHAQVILLNPHHTDYNVKLNEDWTPIVDRLARPAYRKYEDIATSMHWVAEKEMPKRLKSLGDHGYHNGRPLFVIIDELPAIMSKIKEFPAWMADVLQQGRKVDIFLITAAQDFLVKTLKLDSGGVRDCFRTAFYVGGDETTARNLLDIRGPVDDGSLGKGIGMIRSSQVKKASLVRLPLTSNESLYRLLGPSRFSNDQISEMRRVYREGRVTEVREEIDWGSDDEISTGESKIVELPMMRQKQAIPSWQQVANDFANQPISKRKIMDHYSITGHQAYKILQQIQEEQERSGVRSAENGGF